MSDTTVAIAVPGFVDGDVYGAGFIYRWNGHEVSTLALEAVVVRTDAHESDEWGDSVAVQGDLVAIGSMTRGVALLERDAHGEWHVARTVEAPDRSYEAFGRSAFLGDTIAIGARQGPPEDERGEILFYDWALGRFVDSIPVPKSGRWTPSFVVSTAELMVFTWNGTRVLSFVDGRRAPGPGDSLTLWPDATVSTGAFCRNQWWVSTFGKLDRWAIHRIEQENGGWRERGSLDEPKSARDTQFGSSLVCAGDCLLAAADTDVGLPRHAGAVHVVGNENGRPRVVKTLHGPRMNHGDNFGSSMAAAGKWWFIGEPSTRSCAEGIVSIFERVNMRGQCEQVDVVRRFDVRAREGIEKATDTAPEEHFIGDPLP